MNLTANVLLNSKSNERFQYVYSSQLYGTFFNIYGKFNYDENSSKLISAQFSIVNYKGAFNIGIKKVNFKGKKLKSIKGYELEISNKKSKGFDVEKEVHNFKSNDNSVNCISFNIHVQALNKNIVSKEILINEIILSSDNQFLEIHRKVKPIKRKYANKIVFDSEYFYRDGLREPLELRREYRDGENKLLNFKKTDRFVGSGGICPKGYSLIVF